MSHEIHSPKATSFPIFRQLNWVVTHKAMAIMGSVLLKAVNNGVCALTTLSVLVR